MRDRMCLVRAGRVVRTGMRMRGVLARDGQRMRGTMCVCYVCVCVYDAYQSMHARPPSRDTVSPAHVKWPCAGMPAALCV